MGKIKIPWAKPHISEEERIELMDAFNSGWLSSGPKVKSFESKLASYLEIKNAIAVSNGTDAIDIVLKTLGIDKNALIPEKKINTRAKITAPGLLKQPSIIDFMFYSQLILYSISSPGLTKA